MRKLSFALAVLSAIVTCGSASAATGSNPLGAIVVGSQHGTLLLALPNGTVKAVHGKLAIGTKVSFGGGRLVATGRAHRAVVRGIVVRHRGNVTFLSIARHVVVLRAQRMTASVRDAGPAAGTVVQSTVKIDDQGDLDEINEEAFGNVPDTDVQATVSAVAPGSVTLTVNGQTLTLPLPAGLTLPPSIVGTTVTLKVAFDQGVATGRDEDGQGDDNDDVQAGLTPSTAPVTTTPTTTTTTVITTSRDGDNREGGGDGHHGDGAGHD